MFKWLHHLFNPHCEHCREEREESKICASCEVLKLELAHERREKELLLERILEKPAEPEKQAPPTVTLPRSSRGLPWAVKRQMLEEEDRARAKALRESAKPDPTVTTLEEELGVAEEKQETADV